MALVLSLCVGLAAAPVADARAAEPTEEAEPTAEPPSEDEPSAVEDEPEPTSSPAPTAEDSTPVPAESEEASSEEPTESTESKQGAPSEPTVHLHLESTKPGSKLELFQVTEETLGGGGLSFRRVCGSPCDLRLPSGAEYFVSVGKDTQSRTFTIDGYGERVIVRARPGSRAAVIVGEVLIAMGAMAIVGGVGMIVAGEVLDRRPLVLGGGGSLGGGLGALAIGIPLQLAVGRSRVREVAAATR